MNPYLLYSLAGVGIYILLWMTLAVALRKYLSFFKTTALFNSAFLIAAAETAKRLLPLSPDALPWLRAVELIALAYLTIQLVVRGYLSFYLEQKRKAKVNLIIRDILSLVIIAAYGLLFLRTVLGWNLAAILTPSAILTAIIGLSMQDTIGSLIAGIVLQLEKPFDVGDWVEVDGKRGQVREINWRYTKIETSERLYLIIPNNKISSEKIVNYSQPTTAVKEFLPIGISYDVPPFRAKQAILSVLRANPRLSDKDACEALLRDYGESSIQYLAVYFIRDFSIRLNVMDEIYSALWYQFKKQDIEIPFPIRTVMLRKTGTEPDRKTILDALRGLPLLQGLSGDSLALVAKSGCLHTLKPGSPVVTEGAAGHTMFFILEGEFAVLKGGVPSATLGPGGCFGELCLLADAPRSATIEAKTAGTLLEIDRGLFRALLSNEPSLTVRIEQLLDERTARETTAGRTDDATGRSPELSLFSRFKRLFDL